MVKAGKKPAKVLTVAELKKVPLTERPALHKVKHTTGAVVNVFDSPVQPARNKQTLKKGYCKTTVVKAFRTGGSRT